MVSMRQEMTHIRQEHERHMRRVGETVVWFEMVPFGDDPATQSVWGDLYDEAPEGPGGRRFKPGVPVPVFWVIENEDRRAARPDAQQLNESIRFATGYEMLAEAGISEPWESKKHNSDVVYYDGRYYQIEWYRTMGRLQDDVAVSVFAREIFLDQEMVNDPGPALPALNDLPWPTELP